MFFGEVIIVQYDNFISIQPFQEAIKSFKKALSIPTVAENPDMVTEFEDSILYLETVYSVIQEENLGEIPFYDIPQEYMSKIESIYNNRKSR